MKPITVFDTETTGLPDWKSPSGSESQPHLVQLGVIQFNPDTGDETASLDLIIRPDDWEIPEDVTKIHGITQEMAMDVGVDERMAINMLMEMWRAGPRVAHNRTFDQRIIRIALKRYEYPDHLIEMWGDKDTFEDTMLMAKPLMQLGKKGKYGYKPPKLEEAYKHFTGKDLENAHTAMGDARATKELYLAIREYQATDMALEA